MTCTSMHVYLVQCMYSIYCTSMHVYIQFDAYIQFNACIFNSMHVFNAMHVQCMYIQVNACIFNHSSTGFSTASNFRIRIFPELSLNVTATNTKTCASLSIIISCHLSKPINSNISYLLGYYTYRSK